MSMRGPKSGRGTSLAVRKAKSAQARPISKQAEELIDLAVDAAGSRHLPDSQTGFSERAAALAGHAALALENFRRFSQLERSKRNWVEDIDAITDYIVVHDRRWRILRTNRSLATHLGVPPVALVGEAVGTLRQLAETPGSLPCPFCVDTEQSREERIITARDRVFLVSTSRTSGTTDEEARTIHVLKDITDRREAERRYREVFDRIQEGLFFATPDGRFLDVNDAMVRMLGYESRDEDRK